jgi:hypothetical protein
LLAAQLEPNEYAHTDFQLRRLLSAIAGDAPDESLREAVDQIRVRSAESAVATDQAMGILRARLAERGFVLYHGFITAISTRVIRPGSTPASDAFLHQVAQDWVQEEQRLGVELDGRSIAYRWSREDRIDQILTGAGIALPDVSAAPGVAVQCDLWAPVATRPRGPPHRTGALQPLCGVGGAERLLVSAHLPRREDSIAVDAADWREEALSNGSQRPASPPSAPARPNGRHWPTPCNSSR